MNSKLGIILKCIGGFYYVSSEDDHIYECKARGIFRKSNIRPTAGDKVTITVLDDNIGVIDQVLPRKNVLVRPPIANVDQLFIVSSVLEPKANTMIIDQMTVISELLNIEPIIVFSKIDLCSSDKLKEVYSTTGIKNYSITKRDAKSIVELRNLLDKNVSAFVGNSGVGKSTLINVLFPELKLETGEISQKLGRGKHTTRQVELFKFFGGYFADTPGFSSIDLIKCVDVSKENLAQGFKEFKKHINCCKFSSCSHTTERDCAVVNAVNNGVIHSSRYASYIDMYNKIKTRGTF